MDWEQAVNNAGTSEWSFHFRPTRSYAWKKGMRSYSEAASKGFEIGNYES